jgi:anti-anti-sigma factor
MTICCAAPGERPRVASGSSHLAPDTAHPPGDPVPLLDVALVPAPDRVVVRLTGEADLSTVPLLTHALGRAAGIGTPNLVVDVAGTRFWDSSALRALAGVRAELTGAGRTCRIVGAGSATRRLVHAADLADLLDLDGPAPQRVAPAVPAGAISPHRWA